MTIPALQTKQVPSTPANAQLDALRLAESLRHRLTDFAAESGYLRDPHLAQIAARLRSGPSSTGGLLSDIWVEGAFPPKTSDHTLSTLVNEGIFPKSLRDHLNARGVMPKDRLLFTHQAEAVRLAVDKDTEGKRPALVVTAGTGAGKTESFLLPLLADLWEAPGVAAGTSGGVRAIILYPMNALVNDQVERLMQWLTGQDVSPSRPRVRLFHFTGETPEDHHAAQRDNVPPYPDPCRVRTRQEARGREQRNGSAVLGDEVVNAVPDILITNYSMLEYMLCRPQDSIFFGPALRTLVLDEAHLYTGTLAAEITLLLRRLLQRCSRQPEEVLQIATSATLGGGAPGLARFASRIFTKSPDLVSVIEGEPKRVELMPTPNPPVKTAPPEEIAATNYLEGPTFTLGAEGTAILVEDPKGVDILAERLTGLVNEQFIASAREKCGGRPAALLREALAAAPIMARLEDLLWTHKRLPLSDLAEAMWPKCEDKEIARNATARLLELGATARYHAGDYPLIPHRLHVLARAADGLSICLNAGCTSPSIDRLPGIGGVVAGAADRCSYCGGACLSLFHCTCCGEWVLAGVSDGSGGLRPVPTFSPLSGMRFFTRQATNPPMRLDAVTARIGSQGCGVRELVACPQCADEDEDSRNSFAPLSSVPSLALSIVAETTLAGTTPFPSPGRLWLPARGRRLLAFSDSRREAARLGLRLTRQHERQMVRALFASQCIGADPGPSPARLSQLDRKIRAAELELAEETDIDARNAIIRDIAGWRTEQTGLHAGRPVAEWVQLFSELPDLGELMDPDFAAKEEAEKWSQHGWQKNRDAVADRSLALLGRELAAPARRQTSLETIGLVEVAYPRLQEEARDGGQLAPDDALRAVAEPEARQALTACWPDFLALLLDTIRQDGAITLGKDILDEECDLGGRRLGIWMSESQTRGGGYQNLARFVGVTNRQRRRRFAAAVMRVCGVPIDRADSTGMEVLRAAFGVLLSAATGRSGDCSSPLPWLYAEERQTDGDNIAWAIRILFPQLALKRPSCLYRSERTGLLFPRAASGCGPESGCNDLVAVAPAELDTDGRFGRLRREYQDLRPGAVFATGVWAEEHSAQLAARENRRLQDLFKKGVRNILSSTTTLELGIDIGGLNAVLMTNVPPGKANYLQRAGRAGRRADGSSVVVTFARPSPYDRAVFHRFGDYLARELRRPEVHLRRERLARRHGHALLLGEMFAVVHAAWRQRRVGAMRAFGKMGDFCGVKVPAYWDGNTRPPLPIAAPLSVLPVGVPWWNGGRDEAGMESRFIDFLHFLRDQPHHPATVDTRQRLDQLYADTEVSSLTGDWTKFIGSILADFQRAVDDWKRDWNNLMEDWQGGDEDAPRASRRANALRYQMKALAETTVIEALADRQFLPRYGFPIGVQKLRVIVPELDSDRPGANGAVRFQTREEDQYRLERDGMTALGEYVPGSQLLVGGKLITSRGLLKHWTGAQIDDAFGLGGELAECVNGHAYYDLSSSLGNCPACAAPRATNVERLLLPRHGYTTAAWDPPRRSADVEGVGFTQRVTIAFRDRSGRTVATTREDDFGGVVGLSALYREDGELLAYNRGAYDRGFAICTRCGYADSESPKDPSRIGGDGGAVGLPGGFRNHAPIHASSPRFRCWTDGETPVLRHRTLAAREITDILLLDLETCFRASSSEESEAVARTLAAALQISGARMLELDGRELAALVTATGDKSFGPVVYDNVPGGAGHVYELLRRGREWLHAAFETLYVDAAHDRRCDTACLDCILTFDAQMAMDKGLLQRRKASEILGRLLGIDHGAGNYQDARDPVALFTSPSAQPMFPDDVSTNENNIAPVSAVERAARTRLARSRQQSS